MSGTSYSDELGKRDAAASAGIRAGHRRLLESLREFLPVFSSALSDQPDAEGLRAAVAFLRESLLRFAGWEEQQLAPSSPEAEDTAFEHAFLAGEIDALGRSITVLLDSPGQQPLDRRSAGQAVLTHAWRIEAVLELHVLKAEERETLTSASWRAGEAAPTVSGGCSGGGRPREMTAAELDRHLRAGQWALLSTVGGEQPYAVPVSYAWDGRALYLACSPGRKLRNLEQNPRVCLTLVEVASGESWRSVVVSGRAEPVEDPLERLKALRLIAAQRSASARLSILDAARAAKARVIRILPTERSGRIRG